MDDSIENLADEALIRQTIAGDTDSFAVLVRRYQDRLYNSMVHFLRNTTDAEDVVQDAFVLALTRLDSFKGNSQFYTWLYRIAHNVAISRLRRKKPTLSLDRLTTGDGSGETGRLDIPDGGAAPEDRMRRQEDVSTLMRAMDDLSEEHRGILLLREMEGMDYEQIADVLRLAVGTVRSRLHRARGQLRERVEFYETHISGGPSAS